MEKNKQPLSRAQEKAKSFIEEYQVEKIISEMLNSLVHSRDPNPIIFMIKYLSNLVTEQELEEHGIRVTGPVPQRVPIITYPKFEADCDSLLKKHLTREIWSNMKKKSTSKGGNIQMCVKSGVSHQMQKIGAMATDDEAYKTFGDLFSPIIKDLHPQFDYRYSYKYAELKAEEINEQIRELDRCVRYVNDFKVEVSRNFRGTPFTPLMTKEAKLQVERKAVEVLGDLYGTYTQIQKLDDKDVKWLQSVGVDAKNRNQEHDAAGINDDWPVGRGIFIQDKKDFIVLVNFEEHLKIITLLDKSNENDNLMQGISRAIKLLQTFEKLGYATDPYLGNLTVSPQNLGTAMKLWCKVGIDAKNSKYNPEELKKQLSFEKNITYERLSDTEHLLGTTQTLGQGYNEMLQFATFINAIRDTCGSVDPNTIL